MWFLKWIISILIFPVNWFWKSYEKYEQSGDSWDLILSFLISLSGVLLLGGAFLWISYNLFVFHIEIVMIVAVVIWLYTYVKMKMDEKVKILNEEQLTKDQALLKELAEKGYPIIRNILYQTLKGTAESIGGVIPRLLAEIEMQECRYTLVNQVVFYQFKLYKQDIKMQYKSVELEEFKRILQTAVSRKIQAGEFPSLGTESYLDAYGNIYDAVYVDVIEDMDSCFVIQAVFYSPAYSDYLRKKQMNQKNIECGGSIPDAKWNE